MPTAATNTSTTAAAGSDRKSGKDVQPRTETALVTDHGTTTITDTVVTKIAGIAAREITGVHKLGGGAARAFGAVRDLVPGSKPNLSQGVSVAVGERQAAVDLDIVVDYGVEIGSLTKAVRSNVITSIERMTSLEVTEVNITVDDVYIEGEDDSDSGSSSADSAPRVQ